ncbi:MULTISPECIES: hypothetical protein [Mycobacterium simiae complex]|nr:MULTISPECIES: hypothetical protein [Mycobacterium simiae complex]MEC4761832.1 hypothetical protein [Mycobacterium sherrisii]
MLLNKIDRTPQLDAEVDTHLAHGRQGSIAAGVTVDNSKGRE